MCSGSEEGSYLRFMTFVSLDSRLESDKEEEDGEEFDLLCRHPFRESQPRRKRFWSAF